MPNFHRVLHVQKREIFGKHKLLSVISVESVVESKLSFKCVVLAQIAYNMS